MISLYFHLPFCTKKCDYCHFFVLPNKEALKAQLMESLHLEWKMRFPQIEGKKICTVYFGGGTPALFGPERIAEILSWIPLESGAEVTLEANPENITLSLMEAYAKAGINRVSIGIQSLDDRLLQALGREHSAEKAQEGVHTTAQAGIQNISVDLMYDLPGQTLSHWNKTLEAVTQLPITHLSLYNLTLEPHTVFFKKRVEISKLLPEPEVSLEMYTSAVKILESYALKQYEISAFSKPGYIAQHNVGYWTARPFLGFGPSAFSYMEGKRFRNIAHLGKYAEQLSEQFPIDFEEELDPDAKQRELLAIRLRLMEGVDLSAFELDEDTTSICARLAREGFLSQSEKTLKLTPQGILFYDTVASEIVK